MKMSNFSLSALDGVFKEVYADNIINLLPGGVVVTKLINFVSKQKEQGSQYHQPVILQHSHGFTYSSSGDAFVLQDPVAGQTKDATIDAFQILLRDRISYQAASRAASGRNAFIDATQLVVQNMRESIAKRLEVGLI